MARTWVQIATRFESLQKRVWYTRENDNGTREDDDKDGSLQSDEKTEKKYINIMMSLSLDEAGLIKYALGVASRPDYGNSKMAEPSYNLLKQVEQGIIKARDKAQELNIVPEYEISGSRGADLTAEFKKFVGDG